MPAPTPAAQALITALSDPNITHVERQALAAALAALAPAAPRSPPEPKRPKATGQGPARRAASRRLTRDYIAALALPDGRAEHYVYDTLVPQLAVRIRPGAKTYAVVVWDKARNRAVKETLGKVDVLSPEQARKQAAQILARVADGEDVRRSPTGDTLKQLIADWATAKRASVRTVDEITEKLLHYLGPLAHKPADKVTKAELARIHQHIATKGQKRIRKRLPDGTLAMVPVGKVGLPATADKWIAMIGAVYEWAISKDLLEDNPASSIGKAYDAKAAARTNYLHGEALAKFWKALETEQNGDVRDALLIALFTGRRRGNVLEMRWEDVDLDHGIWTTGAESNKQKDVHSSPLVSQVRVILDRRKQSSASAWVFPASRGEGCMTEKPVRDAWQRVCTAAGVKDIRVHDLRHTSGSWLARLGAGQAVRQKALGHKTAEMSARYAHLELDPVAVALQQASDAISKVGGRAG